LDGAIRPEHEFRLSAEQCQRLSHDFPRSRGRKRVDDRRVLSGIIHAIRNGLRWRDAPSVDGPHKTLYDRYVRWTRSGVFDRIFTTMAEKAGPPDRIIIDATHHKAHRTSVSLRQKRGFAPDRTHQRRPELKAARGL